MNDAEVAIKLYQSINEASEPRVFEHWHASSISDCLRAHYYKRLAVPPTNTPSGAKRLRWETGHLMEEVIRPHLGTLHEKMLSNQRLFNERWDLTGEYDNLAIKEDMLIEVKTVHNRAFKHRKVGDDRYHLRDGEPYLNHLYQNHAYTLLLGEVSKIRFVYLTLDGRIAVYTTDFNPAIMEAVKKRLGILNRAWRTNKVPPCQCRVDGEENTSHPLWYTTMQYCDYQTDTGCCELELMKGAKK